MVPKTESQNWTNTKISPFLYFGFWGMCQAIIIYIPTVKKWFVFFPGKCWFLPLANKTGPVVSQDIMDPPWQGLVAVTGHLCALLSVLKV